MALDGRSLAIGIVLLGLLGASEVRRFERDAAREIRSKLQGESASVRVTTRPAGLFGYIEGSLSSVTIRAKDFSTEGLPLYTEPERSKRGKVARLHLDLLNFTLSRLRVERLQATIPECRYDLGLATRKRRIRLSHSGVGTGSVVILGQDLEAFILSKYPEIKRVSVRLEDGRAIVEGYGEFLIVKSNFRVEARLGALDGSKLVLSDAVVQLDGGVADEMATKVLLDTLNPVVDLNEDLKLHGAIYVESLELEDGRLIAKGRTTIPVAPAGSAGALHEPLSASGSSRGEGQGWGKGNAALEQSPQRLNARREVPNLEGCIPKYSLVSNAAER